MNKPKLPNADNETIEIVPPAPPATPIPPIAPIVEDLHINNKFDIVPKIVTLNSKSSTLISIPQTDDHATVTVFNDIENKNWIIVLDEEERQRLHNAVANYMKQVYVTAQENKNMLYRVFDVDLNALISSGSVTVPHELVVESITSKIRLFTIKFFDSYALKEKYEPKV